MPELKWEAGWGVMGMLEYQAFIAWYRSIYGEEAPIPPNTEELWDSPAYLLFKEQGKPGFVSLGELPEEEAEYAAAQWIPPAEGEEEAPWEDLGMTEEEYKRFIQGFTEFEAGEAYRRWQRAQAEEATALERERFEWQMSEAALARQASARERELADRLRLQQELAQLGGPADWIKRWQMIHGVIPRAEATWMSEQAWSLLTEAQDLTGAERLAKEQQSTNLLMAADRLVRQTRGLPEAPGFYYSPMKEWTPAEMEQAQAWEQVQHQGGVTPAPPAPEWLPQFVKGQEAGQPITKGKTTTPSGQQWTRTPWSVREGLRGYTEFAGYRPYQDILEEMAMMAPRTPAGAGRTQWKPATQRA